MSQAWSSDRPAGPIVPGLGRLQVVLHLERQPRQRVEFEPGRYPAVAIVVEELREHPEFVTHIGEVSSFELNLMETAQQQEAGGDTERMVFDIEGARGSGYVIVSIQEDPLRILDATLVWKMIFLKKSRS